MSNFWNLNNGQQATGEVTENNFDPLAKGWYTSMLEEVSVDEYQGVKKIKIKARVVGEGPGKNRVLFLGLKAFEGEGVKESQRDRAIQILVKMYSICKAKLPSGEPDDRSLSQLIDKPIDLMLDVWDIEGKTGNYLINVEARGEKAGSAKAAPKAAPKAQPSADMDSDIPF